MEALREPSGGRYEIVDQIGEGTTGPVYLARDLESGRDVALKTLNEAGSLDDDDLERLRRLFLNEASASSLLSHPGIVQIYDLIDQPGRSEIFLVMEYVEGSSLAEILARPDPLPFDFVVNVVGEVARVLDHVHAHGVVHRDIKPANILISGGSGIRVTDFGIAELRDEDLGQELQRSGSPNYMSPERVLGTGADHRADIWALGVVLYELITRRLPFRGESVAELVTAIAADEPVPLDAHGAAAVPGLQPILDRALAKEPEQRYASAGEIARDLEAVQAGQVQLSATLPAVSMPEVAAGDTEPPAEAVAAETESGGRWAAWTRPLERLVRRPRVAAAIAALMLAAAVGLWLGARGGPTAEAGESQLAALDHQQQRRFEYLALLEQARQMLERGEYEPAAEILTRAEELSPNARRIRALREEARRKAEQEAATQIEMEVATLIGTGAADLAEGRLEAAAEAVRRALELSPGHTRALGLRTLIEDSRREAEARARRVRAGQAEAGERAASAASPVRPAPVEQRAPEPAPAPKLAFSDLRIDFYSELPRGVVTVYRDESQVLRRPFRFVEKRGFLRTKGTSGGFDEQVRVKAGPSAFRIYLSLPNRETQVRRVTGSLAPGARRTLELRVGAGGDLAAKLR